MNVKDARVIQNDSQQLGVDAERRGLRLDRCHRSASDRVPAGGDRVCGCAKERLQKGAHRICWIGTFYFEGRLVRHKVRLRETATRAARLVQHDFDVPIKSQQDVLNGAGGHPRVSIQKHNHRRLRNLRKFNVIAKPFLQRGVHGGVRLRCGALYTFARAVDKLIIMPGTVACNFKTNAITNWDEVRYVSTGLEFYFGKQQNAACGECFIVRCKSGNKFTVYQSPDPDQFIKCKYLAGAMQFIRMKGKVDCLETSDADREECLNLLNVTLEQKRDIRNKNFMTTPYETLATQVWDSIKYINPVHNNIDLNQFNAWRKSVCFVNQLCFGHIPFKLNSIELPSYRTYVLKNISPALSAQLFGFYAILECSDSFYAVTPQYRQFDSEYTLDVVTVQRMLFMGCFTALQTDLREVYWSAFYVLKVNNQKTKYERNFYRPAGTNLFSSLHEIPRYGAHLLQQFLTDSFWNHKERFALLSQLLSYCPRANGTFFEVEFLPDNTSPLYETRTFTPVKGGTSTKLKRVVEAELIPLRFFTHVDKVYGLCGTTLIIQFSIKKSNEIYTQTASINLVDVDTTGVDSMKKFRLYYLLPFFDLKNSDLRTDLKEYYTLAAGAGAAGKTKQTESLKFRIRVFIDGESNPMLSKTFTTTTLYRPWSNTLMFAFPKDEQNRQGLHDIKKELLKTINYNTAPFLRLLNTIDTVMKHCASDSDFKTVMATITHLRGLPKFKDWDALKEKQVLFTSKHGALAADKEPSPVVTNTCRELLWATTDSYDFQSVSPSPISIYALIEVTNKFINEFLDKTPFPTDWSDAYEKYIDVCVEKVYSNLLDTEIVTPARYHGALDLANAVDRLNLTANEQKFKHCLLEVLLDVLTFVAVDDPAMFFSWRLRVIPPLSELYKKMLASLLPSNRESLFGIQRAAQVTYETSLATQLVAFKVSKTVPFTLKSSKTRACVAIGTPPAVEQKDYFDVVIDKEIETHEDKLKDSSTEPCIMAPIGVDDIAFEAQFSEDNLAEYKNFIRCAIDAGISLDKLYFDFGLTVADFQNEEAGQDHVTNFLYIRGYINKAIERFNAEFSPGTKKLYLVLYKRELNNVDESTALKIQIDTNNADKTSYCKFKYVPNLPSGSDYYTITLTWLKTPDPETGVLREAWHLASAVDSTIDITSEMKDAHNHFIAEYSRNFVVFCTTPQTIDAQPLLFLLQHFNCVEHNCSYEITNATVVPGGIKYTTFNGHTITRPYNDLLYPVLDLKKRPAYPNAVYFDTVQFSSVYKNHALVCNLKPLTHKFDAPCFFGSALSSDSTDRPKNIHTERIYKLLSVSNISSCKNVYFTFVTTDPTANKGNFVLLDSTRNYVQLNRDAIMCEANTIITFVPVEQGSIRMGTSLCNVYGTNKFTLPKNVLFWNEGDLSFSDVEKTSSTSDLSSMQSVDSSFFLYQLRRSMQRTFYCTGILDRCKLYKNTREENLIGLCEIKDTSLMYKNPPKVVGSNKTLDLIRQQLKGLCTTGDALCIGFNACGKTDLIFLKKEFVSPELNKFDVQVKNIDQGSATEPRNHTVLIYPEKSSMAAAVCNAFVSKTMLFFYLFPMCPVPDFDDLLTVAVQSKLISKQSGTDEPNTIHSILCDIFN